MESEKKLTYNLQPGFIFMSKEHVTVQTVLGSCVSVCIWDKVSQFGGLNHYIYPLVRERDKALPIYGNVAVITLLRMMEEAGSRPENMIAYIIGGADPVGAENNLGEQNYKLAKRVLKHCKIKIVSEDVGGSMGRKILYDNRSGQLAVLKVHNLRKSDWYSLKEDR